MTTTITTPAEPVCACCTCRGHNHDAWPSSCFISHRHGCSGGHGKRESCNSDVLAFTTAPVVSQQATVERFHVVMTDDGWTCDGHEPDVECSDCRRLHDKTHQALAAAGLLSPRTITPEQWEAAAKELLCVDVNAHYRVHNDRATARAYVDTVLPSLGIEVSR